MEVRSGSCGAREETGWMRDIDGPGRTRVKGVPLARLVFAGLLLAVALGQALSVPSFVQAVESYRVAGPAGSSFFAFVLLTSEGAAGSGLLTPWPGVRIVAGWLGLGAASVWAGLAVQAFVRTLPIPN